MTKGEIYGEKYDMKYDLTYNYMSCVYASMQGEINTNIFQVMLSSSKRGRMLGPRTSKNIFHVGFDDNKDLSPCQGIKAHKMDSVMKENEESYDELHANIL